MSKLSELLAKDISSRQTVEQRLYYNLQKAERTKDSSMLGEAANRIIQEVLNDIDKSSINALKLRKERVLQLQKSLKESSMPEEEYAKLNESISKVQKAITYDLSRKTSYFNKIKRTVSKNFIDVGAIITGIAANDPLAAFAVKYVGDRLAARKEAKQQEAAEHTGTMIRDSEKLISAESAKPSPLGGWGDGDWGDWDDDFFGGGRKGKGGRKLVPQGGGLGSSDEFKQLIDIQKEASEYLFNIWDILDKEAEARKAKDLDELEEKREGRKRITSSGTAALDAGMGDGAPSGKTGGFMRGLSEKIIIALGLHKLGASKLIGNLFKKIFFGIPKLILVGIPKLALFLGKLGLGAITSGVGISAMVGVLLGGVALSLYEVMVEGVKEFKDTSVGKIVKKINSFLGINLFGSLTSGIDKLFEAMNDLAFYLKDSVWSTTESTVNYALKKLPRWAPGRSELQKISRELGIERAEIYRDYKTKEGSKERLKLTENIESKRLMNQISDGTISKEDARKKLTEIAAPLKEYNKKQKNSRIEAREKRRESKRNRVSSESDPTGGKLSPEAWEKTVEIANRLGADPLHLVAAMDFETGGTFDPAELNRLPNGKSSGATGLIQFMPKTARGLGTTTDQLAKMSQVEQLDYVEKHLRPFSGKLKSIEDVYMAIFQPAAVGRSNDSALFRTGSEGYNNNPMDWNRDGILTKGEAAAKVRERLAPYLASAKNREALYNTSSQLALNRATGSNSITNIINAPQQNNIGTNGRAKTASAGPIKTGGGSASLGNAW